MFSGIQGTPQIPGIFSAWRSSNFLLLILRWVVPRWSPVSPFHFSRSKQSSRLNPLPTISFSRPSTQRLLARPRALTQWLQKYISNMLGLSKDLFVRGHVSSLCIRIPSFTAWYILAPERNLLLHRIPGEPSRIPLPCCTSAPSLSPLHKLPTSQ